MAGKPNATGLQQSEQPKQGLTIGPNKQFEVICRSLAGPASMHNLRQAAPAGTNLENYLQAVQAALWRNYINSPDYSIIGRCKPESIFDAVRQGLSLGLSFDVALQHAYLVPFGDQCQFQPSYRGLMALAKRSKDALSFEAVCVHDGDVFEYERGTRPRIRHIPQAPDGAQMTHVYAVVWLATGRTQFDVMSRAEVDKIRNATAARNKGREGPAWKSSYEEMAKKTTLKRLVKMLDLDTNRDLARAIALDNQAEGGEEQIVAVPDIRIKQPTPTQDALAEVLGLTARQPAADDTGEVLDELPFPSSGSPGLSDADKAAIVAEENAEAEREQREREAEAVERNKSTVAKAIGRRKAALIDNDKPKMPHEVGA